MITINGAPFDVSAISANYAANSVEQQVLDALSTSTDIYKYNSQEVLVFELSLRGEIVAAAEALYKSRMGFAVFNQSQCNPNFWDRTDNGGFSLKSGADAAMAITDIYTNGRQYATECATAMVIIYYKALLEVYGEELFNKTFKTIYLMNWSIREPLLREVGTPKKVGVHLLGDRAYFMNPDVNPETPWWQGENVIVLPGEKYYGHGIGIHTAGQIIKSLNAQRKGGATQDAYLMDAVGRPNFQKLQRVISSSAPGPFPSRIVWKPFPEPVAQQYIV